MPNRCVAGGCSNVPDPSRNIGLHKFPDEDDKKRRKLWVNFVLTKRAKWVPSATSRLCSTHFTEDCFERPFIDIPGTSFSSRATLKKDAVPTIHAISTSACKEASTSQTTRTDGRKRRRVSKATYNFTALNVRAISYYT